MRRRIMNFLRINPEVPAILLPPVDYQKDETKLKVCKKCGKEFQRGLFMHEKHCKVA